jgi:hypothetical protein
MDLASFEFEEVEICQEKMSHLFLKNIIKLNQADASLHSIIPLFPICCLLTLFLNNVVES